MALRTSGVLALESMDQKDVYLDPAPCWATRHDWYPISPMPCIYGASTGGPCLLGGELGTGSSTPVFLSQEPIEMR